MKNKFESNYCERQQEWVKKHKLKEGDKIRVVKKAKSYDNGWNNLWNDTMDKFINKECIFCGYSVNSIQVKNKELDDWFNFPYFVLEPINDNQVTYTITVDKDRYPFAPDSEVVFRHHSLNPWSKGRFVYKHNVDDFPYQCVDSTGYMNTSCVDTYNECYSLSTHAHLIGTTYPADTPACAKCGKAMPDCACEHEYEFKPFQQVLVRDKEYHEWTASIFSHNKEFDYKYTSISGVNWKFCIPFEGNEHLLGTTNKPQIKYNADLI